MPPRYFTAEEANELLATVRPLTERMVAARRAARRAAQHRDELAARVAGNGSLRPGALGRAGQRADQAAAALARAVEALEEVGVVVKDLDVGLVDFPARRGTDDVLLCWRLGEDEVAYWHGLDEGFAGRKPLPL